MIRRTLADAVEVELPKIKGSRFVARLGPARSEEEARAFVDQVRADHPDASHHCYAWRIDADTHRADDDGEPNGTGGGPILARFEGHELEHVVGVVVRYYGGTKLGTGGLVRAYGGAAGEAIEAATVVEEVITTRVSLRCSHGLVGPLQGVASAHDGEVTMEWTHPPTLHIDVPLGTEHTLWDALVERAAGQVERLDR
jgi:uncharacterized YigZ family protein